ncbi:MAG: hypothetical protein ACOYWZ_20085 [Bacillota bacterium]
MGKEEGRVNNKFPVCKKCLINGNPHFDCKLKVPCKKPMYPIAEKKVLSNDEIFNNATFSDRHMAKVCGGRRGVL